MNNTKIHFLLISACALVVLAACETVPAPTTDRQNAITPTQYEPAETPVQTQSDLSANGQEQTPGTEIPLASAADQEVMADALEKDQEALCEQMSTQELQESCRERIVSARQQSEQAARLQTEEDKMAELRNSVQQSNDPQRCGELQDPNQVAGCELNILVNNAIGTGDLSVCDQASVKSTQADCRRDAQELLQMSVPAN